MFSVERQLFSVCISRKRKYEFFTKQQVILTMKIKKGNKAAVLVDILHTPTK